MGIETNSTITQGGPVQRYFKISQVPHKQSSWIKQWEQPTRRSLWKVTLVDVNKTFDHGSNNRKREGTFFHSVRCGSLQRQLATLVCQLVWLARATLSAVVFIISILPTVSEGPFPLIHRIGDTGVVYMLPDATQGPIFNIKYRENNPPSSPQPSMVVGFCEQ